MAANADVTHFLNVDLDLYSRSNLEPLVTAMGTKVNVLYMGRHKRTYRAHLELAGSGLDDSPDSTIRSFCALIGALPRQAAQLWKAAKSRDFNIGVQAAMQPRAYEMPLAAEILKAASKVNARIVLTVYAPADGTRRALK